MPRPAPTTQPTRKDLKPSPALSIQNTPPDSFKGRVMGVMLTDGFDGSLLAALETAVENAGGLIKIIAPAIGGVRCTEDNLHAVNEKIGSAPSVLFDAVAVLPGRDSLAANPAAVAFVNDAFVHCKFIGWSEAALPLMQAARLAGAEDEAVQLLTDDQEAEDFVKACKALRHWPREASFAV